VVARIDSAILHEIARVVQTRSKVPDRVQILKRQYLITYLEDHRQRMEDALRRHDSQVLNMLFGQLASKVKYQTLRESSAAKRAAAAKAKASRKVSPPAKRATPPKRTGTAAAKRVTGKASAKKAAVKPKKRASRR
jgi:hypothetical protein